jgi:hypothetical protein
MKLLVSDAFTTAGTKNHDLIADGDTGLWQVDITAKTGTISAVVSIYGRNPHNSTEWMLLDSAAKTATGQFLLQLHDNLTASANAIAKTPLPGLYRIKVVLSGTSVTMDYKIYGWTK